MLSSPTVCKRDQQLAQDPQAPQEELKRIVREFMALRPIVYANPSCPESIREWIREKSLNEARQGEVRFQRHRSEVLKSSPAQSRVVASWF